MSDSNTYRFTTVEQARFFVHIVVEQRRSKLLAGISRVSRSRAGVTVTLTDDWEEVYTLGYLRGLVRGLDAKSKWK